MEWILVALVVVVGGVAALRMRAARKRRRGTRAELHAARRLVGEDVAQLGELLRGLQRHATGYSMDQASQADWQRARDLHASAEHALPGLRNTAAISKLAASVSAARYAVECVQARLEGTAPPQRRPPCFFDPRHGLQTRDVRWTRPGHGTHTVPACAADVERLSNGEAPAIRTVSVRGITVPYWEAGVPFVAYCQGYFQDDVAFVVPPPARRWSIAPSTTGAADQRGIAAPPHTGGSGGGGGTIGSVIGRDDSRG